MGSRWHDFDWVHHADWNLLWCMLLHRQETRDEEETVRNRREALVEANVLMIRPKACYTILAF